MRGIRIGRRWKAMMFAFFAAIILAGIAGAWRLPLMAKIDVKLSQKLQRYSNPFLDRFMEFMTWIGGGFALPIIALTAAAVAWRFGRGREAIAVVLSLLSLPLNVGLKLLANRPRPTDPITVVAESYGSSFPSGHAMGSMAVFGTLAALAWSVSGRKPPVLILLAIPIAVGISRIYRGAHWGYDVVAGWAAGALCVAAIVLWVRASASRATGSPEAAAPTSSPSIPNTAENASKELPS